MDDSALSNRDRFSTNIQELISDIEQRTPFRFTRYNQGNLFFAIPPGIINQDSFSLEINHPEDAFQWMLHATLHKSDGSGQHSETVNGSGVESLKRILGTPIEMLFHTRDHKSMVESNLGVPTNFDDLKREVHKHTGFRFHKLDNEDGQAYFHQKSGRLTYHLAFNLHSGKWYLGASLLKGKGASKSQGKVLTGSHPRQVINAIKSKDPSVYCFESEDSKADILGINKTLNPQLWIGYKLRPEVREKLVEIAHSFLELSEPEVIAEYVNKIPVSDIYLVGSNANYLYHPGSDLDLHILVDSLELGADKLKILGELATIFDEHHSIKIHSSPVEIYVQDATSPLFASGIYSVVQNKWIKQPKRVVVEADNKLIQYKAERFKEHVDRAEQLLNSKRYKEAWILAEHLRARLRKFRTMGLQSASGEMSTENLSFKLLRSSGTIGKLIEVSRRAYDNMLSVEAQTYKPRFPLSEDVVSV